MLFEAVEHAEAVAGYFLHLRLHVSDVASRLQSELQRSEHALLVEEGAGEVDGGDYYGGVILHLVDGEDHTRRHQRVGHEAFRRVVQIDKLSLTDRCVNLEESLPTRTQTHVLSNAYAGNAIIKIGDTQRKLTVAVENVIDGCQAVKVFVHTLHRHHHLAVAVHRHRLVFHHLRCHLHGGQLSHLREQRVVGSHSLTLRRHHLYLRVEAGEE